MEDFHERRRPLAPLPLLALFSLLSACYGAAPPIPKNIAVPAIKDGALLDVQSESRTGMESVNRSARSCPPSGIDCITTTYTETVPVTRTLTRATYDGVAINYGQFLVLSDEHRAEKLAALNDHSVSCRRGDIPRWLGTGLLIAGTASLLIRGDSDSQLLRYGALIGLFGGAAVYTGGFFYAGHHCVKAQNLYYELDLSEEEQMHEVDGADRAAEMEAVVQRFNSARPPQE